MHTCTAREKKVKISFLPLISIAAEESPIEQAISPLCGKIHKGQKVETLPSS